MQQITIMMQYNSVDCNYRYSLVNVHWREQMCKKGALCFTHSLSLQSELLVCNYKQRCGLQSLSEATERYTLHKGPWILSHVRTEHQEMIWDPWEQQDKNSLCLTHSLPHFPPSPLHLTSCLGPCMLTAAQVTGPQTCKRPALRRGEKRGLYIWVSNWWVYLAVRGGKKAVSFYSKLKALCFHTDVNKRVYFLLWREVSDSTATQHHHMGRRTNSS